MKQRWKIKEGVQLEDIQMLHPNLLIMFGTVLNFAAQRNLPVTITSLIHDRAGVASKSSTHEDGRALDLRVRGWREKDCRDLVKILELEHEHIGAISAKDFKSRPAVYGDERHRDHIHLQVRP